MVYVSLSAQELKPIKLPEPQTGIGKPLMEALKLRQTSRSFNLKPLSVQDLSNLLWAADGINRPDDGKRTAPSAMNWQEIGIYVVLADGAYLYDVKTNLLNPVTAGDLREKCGSQDFVKSAPLNLVYVADMSKVTSKNEDDRTLYTAADCGFIAQNVYLYCASEGLATGVRAMVDRDALSKDMMLRDRQKIVLVQAVGYPQ